jgi:hypothetical protein
MWLFILAGVLLVGAGAVTLSGSQRKADTKEMPPKRPVGLDDAMNTVQAHEAE